MQQVKVDFTLRAVQRRGMNPRYELNVILKDINADQKTFGKNYSNIELQPARPLEMGDYQLILNERGLGDLKQNSKGFRITDADAEVGIGTYAETGDKYYFVRVELCKDLYRTCYLSESQIRNLKYVDLGYKFKEEDIDPVVE
ncbi:hypothetical protein [Haploplasma modicum]|uniref:hypothetical protein n=1 Tax=Haploplasma modicum TaxID=2150 RepID=UPI00047A0240|nr:hypothetical protein [Haploplasma modicum]